MLPKINGKSFLMCTEEDLKLLLDNPDYRENEFIDYKQNFAFLEIPKGKERTEKINEFKNDVCSFANSEGGYLIYGISDVNGCASELIGIRIQNDDTDRFELDRRGNLNNIYPKTPYLKFNFIKLDSGNYIVIIYIKRDNLAPYMYIEDEKNYKIYKRTGNGKQTIMYSELKNMFTQSISLDKEIQSFRTERINYFLGQADEDEDTFSKFLLLHIIPDSFIDTSYNENMYILERNNKYDFRSIFSEFYCSSYSIPCVDGIRFLPTSNSLPNAECVIYNNKIVECFFPLKDAINITQKHSEGCLACGYVWEKIKETLYKYADVFGKILKDQKVYICISIVGCKGIATTYDSEEFVSFYCASIDRNRIICQPISIENIDFDALTKTLLKKLYIEFMLSVGRKNDKTLNELIKDVYHSGV